MYFFLAYLRFTPQVFMILNVNGSLHFLSDLPMQHIDRTWLGSNHQMF